MKYNVRRKTTLSRICIGYIVQCDLNESIGIIYGSGEKVEINGGTLLGENSIVKMFYFKKSLTVKYPPYTIVAYLRQYELYSYQGTTIEVTSVFPLDNFVVYDNSIDTNEQQREDGCYHCDFEWQLMKEAKPFMEIKDTDLYLNVPYIHAKESIVEYYDEVYWLGCERPVGLVGIYYALRFYSPCKNYISIENIASMFDKIKKYVSDFDINEESKKFIVGESGAFIRRIGKDEDYYLVTNFKRTSSTDLYVRELVKLEENKTYYTSGDEVGYYNIDENKTKDLQKEVREAYNRNVHYYHLVCEFLSPIKFKYNAFEHSKKIRCNIIDPQDKQLFQSSNKIDIDYINEFNKLHHRVSIIYAKE